jgi:tetratricopeptide (TPR) repeat protein
MVQMIKASIQLFSPTSSGHRKILTALLSGLLLVSLPPADSSEATKVSENPALDAADQAFRSLHYNEADSLYNILLQCGKESANLYWKLARLNISIAESIDPDESAKKMPLYAKAVEYARKSVELDPDNASAHTWLAASLALKADKIGSKEKVKRAEEIKKELDRALELNPHDDVAWSMLGSYNYQVSKIGWLSRMVGNAFIGGMPQGNRDEAEKDFKKAISLNPRVIRHYHELAILYIDEGRKQEALNILKIAETKPVLMKSDTRRLHDIKRLIAKLTKELTEKPMSYDDWPMSN